jgi:hypothetical protein
MSWFEQIGFKFDEISVAVAFCVVCSGIGLYSFF